MTNQHQQQQQLQQQHQHQQHHQHHQQQQQQYFEDDYTIETIANTTTADDVVVVDEDLVFIHSVFIKIKNRKQQERSRSNVSTSFETLLSEQYEFKEESFFKSWFERKVIHNPRNDRISNTNNNTLTNTNILSIPTLCGLSSNLQIYFRNNEHEQVKSKSTSKLSRKKLKLKPINKMATLLTFNPDTGLYGQLIRGNAYIVINNNKGDNYNSDNSDSDNSDNIITVQILKDILELIYNYKNIYHQYGADFNRDGRTQLLQACSEYKNKMNKKNKMNNLIISNSNNNNQQQSDDERRIAVNNEKKNVPHHTRTDTGITDISSSSSSHSRSHSHSHSSNNSITNIDNIVGSPKQKRRSESSDEYVYSINILDEEISAVHSRNNSATTVDATKIKLLHPPLHPPLHTIATPSTSTSNTIVDSFEDMADEIIFSFQQEVSKTIINIDDKEFKDNYDQRSSAELPSRPTTITIIAGGTTNKNNSTNSHSRKISTLSDTSAPKTIKEEELIQDEEKSLCDNNNNNNTDVETTTTQIKKSHRMNQSLPELLLREESLYPDSHLRSVYNSMIHDEKEKEDNKKLLLTHRSLQLHNNEINEQQHQEVVNKKNHHIVKSISKALASTSPISTPKTKTKTNCLTVYNILQSPSLSLQLSEAAEAESVATIKAPTTTTTTTTSIMEENDTFTLVSENTDNYNNCPKYYSSSPSPSPPPSPPLPPQIPIPGIIVRRLTSI